VIDGIPESDDAGGLSAFEAQGLRESGAHQGVRRRQTRGSAEGRPYPAEAPAKRPVPAEVKLAASLRAQPSTGGRVDIQVWVQAMPKDGLRKLKELGFDLAADLIPGKLLLGTLPAEKLKALAALSWVLYVEPPRFR
jgi:hypothetical protein